MSRLTIEDVRRFIYIKRELKDLRMRIKDHQRVIAGLTEKKRFHEAEVYTKCIADARERQASLGKEAIKLRQAINSGKSCRQRFDNYVGMLRLLGRDDIESITINHPHGMNTISPHVQIAQMLKLTQQVLLLDISESTLTDDERILMRVAKGEAGITVKEALVLSKHFNTGVDYWLDKQKSYDRYLLKAEKQKTYILR